MRAVGMKYLKEPRLAKASANHALAENTQVFIQ